jgi:hypothetical protein
MLRRKFMGLIVGAALIAAISVVGASSASAAVFTLTTTACTGGTNVALCYETAANCTTTEPASKKCELEVEQSETVSGGKVVFTVLTAPVQKIECQKSEGSGTIIQKEPLVATKKTTLQGILKYKECKLTTEPMKKCVVNENNETKELLGTLENEKELKLVPKAGTAFIEITYSNNGAEKCPATFLGTHTVTGSQVVEIINPGVAEPTKSGKAIGETLEFLSAKAELSQELTLTFTGLGDNVYVSKEA